METKKYCTFCGAENRQEDLLCIRCGENLNAEDELLKEFLIERTKDKLKGNLDDSLREIIMNFLKSHLFGMVFTISLVVAISVSAVSSSWGIQQVSKRPDFSNTTVVDQQDENQAVSKRIQFSDEQMEVKEVIDTYFHAMRKLSYVGSVDETVASLIHYEEFTVSDSNTKIVPFFEVEEMDHVQTISLDYQLLRLNPDYYLYYLTGLYLQAGFQVADVTIVETLTAEDNSTIETQYDIILAKMDGGWKICQVCNSSSDMKSLYFCDELIGEQTYQTLQGSKKYYLPEEYGYSSFEDVKDTVELNTSFEIIWYEELGQNYKTELSDQLIQEGYRIAQMHLIDPSTNNKYVMTHVNAAGNWYIAEIVEVAGE